MPDLKIDYKKLLRSDVKQKKTYNTSKYNVLLWCLNSTKQGFLSFLFNNNKKITHSVHLINKVTLVKYKKDEQEENVSQIEK